MTINSYYFPVGRPSKIPPTKQRKKKREDNKDNKDNKTKNK